MAPETAKSNDFGRSRHVPWRLTCRCRPT